MKLINNPGTLTEHFTHREIQRFTMEELESMWTIRYENERAVLIDAFAEALKFDMYIVEGPESSTLVQKQNIMDVIKTIAVSYDSVYVKVVSGVLHIDIEDGRYPSSVPVRIYPVYEEDGAPVIEKYMNERYGKSWYVPDQTSRELNDALKEVSSSFKECIF